MWSATWFDLLYRQSPGRDRQSGRTEPPAHHGRQIQHALHWCCYPWDPKDGKYRSPQRTQDGCQGHSAERLLHTKGVSDHPPEHVCRISHLNVLNKQKSEATTDDFTKATEDSHRVILSATKNSKINMLPCTLVALVVKSLHNSGSNISLYSGNYHLILDISKFLKKKKYLHKTFCIWIFLLLFPSATSIWVILFKPISRF